MSFVMSPATLGILGALLSSAALAQEPPPPSPLPASAPASEADRLSELLALIEGPNAIAVRRTGARELLRQNWPDVRPRIAAILASAENRAARIAVALALCDLPGSLDPTYAEPLVAMLSDADADARQAAGGALALYRDKDSVSRLRSVMLDESRPLPARLAAIDALGLMPQREAAAALVEALSDARSAVARPALAALERATAQSFQNDAAAAQQWWAEACELPLAEWQQLQIERLSRQSRTAQRAAAEVEQRLRSALRDAHARAADADRGALVLSYLSDPIPAVRLAGLEIVRALMVEGKTVAPDAAARTRDLLSAPEPAVRAAAVNTVAGLRDAEDAARFTSMLSSERSAEVRVALVNALGYVGSAGSLPALLPFLESADTVLAGEAITAIGRLAERRVLDRPALELVTHSLLAHARRTPRDQTAAREQLLRAMGRVADLRFGPLLSEALDAGEPPAVRQAAIRGIAALADPKIEAAVAATQPGNERNGTGWIVGLPRDELMNVLVAAVADADVVVRRTAIDALSAFGDRPAHLEALWSRAVDARELDENARESAWRGVLRLLGSRPPEQIETWAARLPDGDDPVRLRRELDLLQLAEQGLGANAGNESRRARVRLRIARLRVALDQPADALSTYLSILGDAQASGGAVHEARTELLRLALSAGLYTEHVAEALATDENGDALLDAIRDDLEAQLTPQRVERLLTRLEALRRHPPGELSGEVRSWLAELSRRAAVVRAEVDRERTRELLEALRRRELDEAAWNAVVTLGPRAAPALRDALRAIVSSDAPDPAYERRLHDLLKLVAPDWPGYDADATAAEKLRTLSAEGARATTKRGLDPRRATSS